MSYDAIRWAWEQPVKPAMRKLVLLAMADCVNAEAVEMVCWPSYAFLAERTGMNARTVETSVYELKTEGYLVDTGRRAGSTKKVVVYRLNTPETGGIKPGPQASDANGTRPRNTPVIGGIGASGNPPISDANPPKNDAQSPPKVQETPPKTGAVTRNRTRKEPGTEPGKEAACGALLPDVPTDLIAAWEKVRKAKHAGPITEPVAAALTRESGKAGLSVAEGVRYCCEAGWQNFNAGYYAKREGVAAQPRVNGASKHAGFAGKNYREGVLDDGSFN